MPSLPAAAGVRTAQNLRQLSCRFFLQLFFSVIEATFPHLIVKEFLICGYN
jgi:hypothetical protein